MAAKPYLAKDFGLFTGTAVRWYVEGQTEYFAISEMLPDAADLGIEVLNLNGVIASGRDKSALKRERLLKDDCASKRFSIMSFDGDVPTEPQVCTASGGIR
jgi:hypothetical protein